MDESTEKKSASNSWSSRYMSFLRRNQKLLHVLLVLLCGASIFFVSKLNLKTDFATLLPDSLDSVVNAKKLSNRLGGSGLLIVGIVGPNYESNRTFAEALAPKLDSLVGKELNYFEYRYDEIRNYLFRYGLHYLSVAQLEDFKTRLSKELLNKKDDAFSSFLGFEEEEEEDSSKEDSSLSQEWIAEALEPSLKKFIDYRDAYLSAENGQVLVFALRPNGSSLGVKEGKKLIDKVQSFIDELKPEGFHPDMQVAFSGNVKQSLEEYETIKKDILGTALLLVVLVLSLLMLFFWSFRVVFLLVAHLLMAVLVTFAITQIHIGYLNSQTAFLGSLVVGTGINYGIILISRFLELFRQGISALEAIEQALSSTTAATIIASSTTAISFISLLYNENKGLSQFAFIGGTGVALCWIMAFTFLPLWIHNIYSRSTTLQERRHPFSVLAAKLGGLMGRGIIKYSYIVSGVFLILTIGALVGVRSIYKSPIEYDFDKVRNKKSVSQEVLDLRKRINSVFSVNLNPAVMIVDTQKQARELCPAFYDLKSSIPEEDNILDSCQSLYNYYPKTWPQQEAKLRASLLKDIKRISSSGLIKYSKHSELARGISENLSMSPPKTSQIPEQLVRRFKELDGRVGLFAYINPDSSKPINDGRNLLKFTKSMTDMPLKDSGTTVTAAGNSFIFADLLAGIQRDGPRVALIAFVGVLLVTFLLCGGLSNSLFIGACLCSGVLWMLGLQGAFGMKYNFFNFIALPLTFGLGVDYPINVFVRCKQEGFKNISKVIRGSGSAVILCSLTTIIGYYTLLGAASQALASFAQLALFGEISCLVVAVVGVPWALKVFRGHFKD